MTYTLITIWLSLLVAALIGLVVGALLRGGAAQARHSELQARISEAEAEADANRAEAARLAAETQTGASDSLERVRLEAELRDARAAADREAAAMDELRGRLEDAEARLAEAAHGGIIPSDYAELERRSRDLQIEIARLEGLAGETAAWRARAEALHTELEAARQGAQSEGPSAADHAELEARARVLETELQHLKSERGELEHERDALKLAVGEGDQQKARIGELEAELAAFSGIDASSVTSDFDDLRAKLARTNAQLEELAPIPAELDRLRSKLSSAERERDAAIAKVENAASQQVDAAQAAAAQASSAEQADERLKTAQAELETARADAATARGEVETFRERVQELEDALENAPPRRPDHMLSGVDLRELDIALDANKELKMKVIELEKGIRTATLSEQAAHEQYAERIQELEALSLEGSARTDYESRITELETQLKSAEERAAAQPTLSAAVSNPANEADDGSDKAADMARLRWRNEYLSSRSKHLETQLAEAKANVRVVTPPAPQTEEPAPREDLIARLQSRVAELEGAAEGAANIAPTPASGGADGGDSYSLEWRNRYLASRVRYLEQRMAEGGIIDADGDSGAASGGRSGGDKAEIALLRSKVNELEQSLRKARAAAAVEPDAEEGDYALEWRNRYLSSRVKYLEERLAETGSDT